VIIGRLNDCAARCGSRRSGLVIYLDGCHIFCIWKIIDALFLTKEILLVSEPTTEAISLIGSKWKDYACTSHN
jgi:hypothetical protein